MSTATDPLGANLETRHLKLFVAIAETGGVSAAARILHVTQSAVSQQLRLLEGRLGTQLFARVNKKFALTSVGDALLPAAHRILADLRDAERQIRRGHSDGECRIRLSTECYSCYFWLPAVFRKLRETYPQLIIQIDVASSADPVAALLAGELDVAIVSSHPTSSELQLERLFEDELLITLSADHPLATREFVRPTDLAGEDVLIYPPRAESFLLQRVLFPAGVQPGSVFELPLTEAIIEMVRARMGIALLARWAIAPYLNAGDVVGRRVTKRGVKRVWSAATRKVQTRHPAVSELIRLMRAMRGPEQLGVRRAPPGSRSEIV